MPLTQAQIDAATLTRQSYGIAMSQCRFGGPRGVWLECKGCDESSVIVGSKSDEWIALPDAIVAGVFRRHGWTGDGDRMLNARCPSCSSTGAQ